MDNFKNIDSSLFDFIEANKDSDCGKLLLGLHGIESPFNP